MKKGATRVMKFAKLPPDGRGKPVDYEGIKKMLLSSPFKWACLFTYNYTPGPAHRRMKQRLGAGFETTSRKGDGTWTLWARYVGTPESWPAATTSLPGETGDPAAEVREKSTL